MSPHNDEIFQAVQDKYGSIARGEISGCGCGTQSPSEVAITLGYKPEELALGENANLGLGCGNPLALADIRPGMTVLDLGSGAGFDAFLAWKRVGPAGRVIGVDMTDDMLELARKNAAKHGATNVEFRKGQIEKLPVEDASVDLIISNCVINLSPDKPAVFREMARVLKPGGGFAVSDLVLVKRLPEVLARDVAAYVGCISGALPLGEYVGAALEAGFRNVQVRQVTWGKDLGKALLPQGAERWSRDVAEQAASAIASVKLHGEK